MKIEVEITTLEQYRRYLNIWYADLNKIISMATYRLIILKKIPVSKKNLFKLCKLFKLNSDEIIYLLK